MSGDNLMVVRDVYGDVHRVSREDYERGRVQLRLYTRTGKRLSEYYAAMGWGGRATTLHRDNVAEIVSAPQDGARG